MTNRAAAARYARALLDVLRKEGEDPQRAERELSEFLALLREHPSLGRVLLNPAIPPQRKRNAVAQILERAGDRSEPVRKLLLLLAERGRLGILSDLVERYRDRLMDHLQIVRAEITTAVPLDESRAGALARSLETTSGKHVTLETRLDRAIIGGVVARIGSVIYDGSVARQLERLKEKLAAEG